MPTFQSLYLGECCGVHHFSYGQAASIALRSGELPSNRKNKLVFCIQPYINNNLCIDNLLGQSIIFCTQKVIGYHWVLALLGNQVQFLSNLYKIINFHLVSKPSELVR